MGNDDAPNPIPPAKAWRDRFFTARDGRADGGPMPGTHPAQTARHWHQRGYLPHFDGADRAQALTFRLGDAVPQAQIDRWRSELEFAEDYLPEDHPKTVELRRRIAVYEDAGHGECWLRQPALAQIVEDALLHFDGTRYRLLAWCVMPNHVHALLEPVDGHAIKEVVKSWKGFSALTINRLVGRTGALWQPDYHDRFIRDARHLAAATTYIEENPVKAGLCPRSEDWGFSSARRRALAPGSAGL